MYIQIKVLVIFYERLFIYDNMYNYQNKTEIFDLFFIFLFPGQKI